MSSSAGPSRVRRPRRSSSATSNGSTASSTGTDDGARTGLVTLILVSGDSAVMAFYLGSSREKRKGLTWWENLVVPAKAGTHHHRVSLLQRMSATVQNNSASAVWVPAFAGT